MRKTVTSRDFADEAIKEYVHISPSVFKTSSNNLHLATADGGNHFTDYGIVEGTLIVFDGELPVEDGKLSLFVDLANPKKPKFKVSLNDVPEMDYVGRAIARVNYF